MSVIVLWDTEAFALPLSASCPQGALVLSITDGWGATVCSLMKNSLARWRPAQRSWIWTWQPPHTGRCSLSYRRRGNYENASWKGWVETICLQNMGKHLGLSDWQYLIGYKYVFNISLLQCIWVLLHKSTSDHTISAFHLVSSCCISYNCVPNLWTISSLLFSFFFFPFFIWNCIS